MPPTRRKPRPGPAPAVQRAEVGDSAVLEVLEQLRLQVGALSEQVSTCATELGRIEKALTETANGHRETAKQVTLLMKVLVAHTKVASTIAGVLEDLKKRTG